MKDVAIFKRVPNGVVVKDGVNAEAEAFPDMPQTVHPPMESEKAFDYLTNLDTQVADQLDIFKVKLRQFVNGFVDSLKGLPPAVEMDVATLVPAAVIAEFTLSDDLQKRTESFAAQEKIGGVMDILVGEGKARKLSPVAMRAMSVASILGMSQGVIDAIAALDGPCDDPNCPIHGTAKDDSLYSRDTTELVS